MSSRVLYPPVIDSYMPAHLASANELKVYFRLSKFNGPSDVMSVHVSLTRQTSGTNAFNYTDDPSTNRYRSTGILVINQVPQIVDKEDNLFYITINGTDLINNQWETGCIYKIQLRLSSVLYDGASPLAKWLTENTNNFSEWSTVCTAKAIGDLYYSIPLLGIDTNPNNNVNSDTTSGAITQKTLYLSTLEIFGHFDRINDPSEFIYSYQFMLYDYEDNLLEDSGIILSNKYQDGDSFKYTFKVELENKKEYKLAFKYETINHYVGGFYRWGEDIDERVTFDVTQVLLDSVNCEILTAENDILIRREDSSITAHNHNEYVPLLSGITSVQEEEEQGRIGLKLYSPVEILYSGNLCIRRSSSKDNFKTWIDFKIIHVVNEYINNLDIIYDYTAESGVWYKYGVQAIDAKGNRGPLSIRQNPEVMRNFNYSYILGQDNKQLKLTFDNTMSSFKHQVIEGKVDPIGSKYPIVTRNAETNYRTFPLAGLISFQMDEAEIFCNKKIIYQYDDVVDLYKKYNKTNGIDTYDFIYERDFRQEVLKFLYDGEMKLFKSPTEGNIIIRIMDVSCTPVQTLGRMIYNFTATAYEMAESTMENYLTYGFYKVGKATADFTTYETKIGQLTGEFAPGTNIISEIYRKYDRSNKNIAGYKIELNDITHLKINFEGLPLRVKNSAGEIVLGNNFYYSEKNNLITVYGNTRCYEFDDRLTFNQNSVVKLLGGEGYSEDLKIPVTVDFLYKQALSPYLEKEIQSRDIIQGVGQFFSAVKPDTNIYNKIYYKYHHDWNDQFMQLNVINSIEIEANPGVTFAIKDSADNVFENHIVGETGILRFTDFNITNIKYIGITDEDGNLDTTKEADVLINYTYSAVKGVYA